MGQHKPHDGTIAGLPYDIQHHAGVDNAHRATTVRIRKPRSWLRFADVLYALSVGVRDLFHYRKFSGTLQGKRHTRCRILFRTITVHIRSKLAAE